jgi:hypothetical protein
MSPALFDAWESGVLSAADEPPKRLFRAPATEESIAAQELRLGVRLPPSYRAFLLHSNGADAFPGWGHVRREDEQPGPSGLLAVENIGLARDLGRQLVSIWTFEGSGSVQDDAVAHPAFAPPSTERAYLLAGRVDSPEADNPPKPGHLLYALAISVNVDGYQTFLNPLVVDADGEWEALDFGTKTVGGNRYRSFASLLAADTGQQASFAERRHEQQEEAALVAAESALANQELPLPDRIAAGWQLFHGGAGNRAVPALADVASRKDFDLPQRAQAVQLLGYIRTQEAEAELVRLAGRAEADDPRLLGSLLPPLAASEDPAARRAAIRILNDPSTPGFAIRGTYRPAGSTLWAAYERSGNAALLPQLAFLGESRATSAVVDALRDPAVGEELRSGLLMYAGYLRDRDVAEALGDAVADDANMSAAVGATLLWMGFPDLALEALGRAVLNGSYPGMGARELGDIDDPRAIRLLLEAVRTRPAPAVLRALAWHPTLEAIRLLETLVQRRDLRAAAIDALELMPLPEAGDALARRSEAGDALAARALARRRDPRALRPLLGMLADADPRRALSGSDGLRDLRRYEAGQALLAATHHADPDVAVCSAHALITMHSSHVPEALESLLGSEDDEARRLGQSWAEARGSGIS